MLVESAKMLIGWFVKQLGDTSSERELTYAAHPGNDLTSFKKRVKMRLRLFVFRSYHRQVMGIFDDHRLQDIAFANPSIYEKIYQKKAHLFKGTTIDDRLQILKFHYKFVRDVFSASLIHSVYVSRDFTLCKISLPEVGKIVTRLAYVKRFEKEGDLTLWLEDHEGNRLYSVSFSVYVSDEKPSALIGCFQGPGLGECMNGEAIKYLTKGMHGMRPKNLIFFLLQVLCRELGIQEILAIANRSHINNGSVNKSLLIKFDYNKFWEELGGRCLNQKYFSLPLHHARRSFEEIQSNKRAAYVRRYAVLDDLETQIQSALQAVSEEYTIRESV